MKKSQSRIFLFCIVTSLYWFSLYAFVPNLPVYAESIGASHKIIGLILGSYGFTQMLIRIPLGVYSDTIGKRKIFILLGLIVAVVSALGMALFPTPSALLIFRGLTGIAAAAWVIYTVLFSSYFKNHEVSKALGYLNAFNALGQMLAMLLGGILARELGARAPFFLAATAGALGIILGLGVVEKTDRQEGVEIPNLLTVGKERGLLIASGLAILVRILIFATAYGFTPIAAEKLGADEFQRALLTTLSTFPTIFGSAMSGAVFGKKFGEKKTLIIGFVIMSISYASIPTLSELKFLYIAEIIGGFARGLILPLLMGLSIREIDASKRATAMGFFQAIYGLGMFLGPVLVGFISDVVDLSWGFWAVAILGMSGAIISSILVDNTL